jgi:hypothetical protein
LSRNPWETCTQVMRCSFGARSLVEEPVAVAASGVDLGWTS